MTDEQDPVPESKWLFRRIYAYAVTLACLFGVGWVINKLVEAQHLAGVAYGLIALCALLATYYLIAPSAEHIVSIVTRLSAAVRRRT